MNATDYTVRSWTPAAGGRERICVVDRHGRIAYVTISRHQAVHGGADLLIRQRLAHLPAHRPGTR